MTTALQFLGDWGHVFAAGLYAVLAIAMGRRQNGGIEGKMLVAALLLTSVWSLSIAFQGVHQLGSGVMESLRNCGWLACLYALPVRVMPVYARGVTNDAAPLDRPSHSRGEAAVYIALIGVLIVQSLADMVWSFSVSGHPGGGGGVGETGIVLRMMWSCGALVLAQRIYASADHDARARVSPVIAAIAAMWTYDLILYGIAWTGSTGVAMLYALRGPAMAGLVPVIALSIRTQANHRIHPSRALTLRGVVVAAVLALLLLLLAGLALVEHITAPVARVAATASVFALIVAGLLVLPTMQFRALLKVMVAKHIFRHRYDYRAQWMGFADTIGQAVSHDVSLYTRAIKAVADITESPAAVLLLMDKDGGHLLVHSQWNWPDDLHGRAIDGTLLSALRDSFWIIDVDAHRPRKGELALPDWLAGDRSAWALVPIVHFDQMTGALLLARPRIDRPLDWEDFDMLRTAGRQVASYIAEAQGQQALAEARRFDEFNRRFAFIMHDIKNLVSQLSLVSRNAERHADNPEFRADMVLTLQECVGKMNDLLARLSQHNSSAAAATTSFAMGDVVRSIMRTRGGAHPIMTDGDLAVSAFADPARVEQIVLHLVQNAIEASAPDSPVVMRVAREGDYATLSVIDYGCGMTGEFVRDELFRPFASSKQGGFGIGAYEARELACTMQGQLSVDSTPGKGSCFTLSLPVGDRAVLNPAEERAA